MKTQGQGILSWYWQLARGKPDHAGNLPSLISDCRPLIANTYDKMLCASVASHRHFYGVVSALSPASRIVHFPSPSAPKQYDAATRQHNNREIVLNIFCDCAPVAP